MFFKSLFNHLKAFFSVPPQPTKPPKTEPAEDQAFLDCCMILGFEKSSLSVMYLIPYTTNNLPTHTQKLIQKTGLAYKVLSPKNRVNMVHYNPFPDQLEKPSLKFPAHFFNLN
jgi:hypothetical protein